MSENLAPKFPSKSRAIFCTPLAACPQKRAPLWCVFFALMAVNGPLPAELKFRENTASPSLNLGCLFFSIGSSNSGTTFDGGDGGGEVS